MSADLPQLEGRHAFWRVTDAFCHKNVMIFALRSLDDAREDNGQWATASLKCTRLLRPSFPATLLQRQAASYKAKTRHIRQTPSSANGAPLKAPCQISVCKAQSRKQTKKKRNGKKALEVKKKKGSERDTVCIMVQQKRERGGERLETSMTWLIYSKNIWLLVAKKNNRVRRKRKWVKENKILSIVRLEFLCCIKGDGRTTTYQ